MRVNVDASSTDQTLVEAEADALIEKFDKWFQSLNNSPLVGMEKAPIKTFLAWAIKGCPDAPSDSPSTPER